MQTALHIFSLVNQLKDEIIGAEIVSTEYYRKQRAAWFFFRKDKKRSALGVIFHPAGFGVCLVPAGKMKIETNEKPWPVKGYENATVSAVEQVGIDRLIRISLTGESERTMLIEAMGPNANIWLLGSDQKIIGTLRKRDRTVGDQYQPRVPLDGLNPFELVAESAKPFTDENPSPSAYDLFNWLHKSVLGFNRTIAREVMVRAGVDLDSDTLLKEGRIASVIESARELTRRFSSYDTGYLYEIKNSPEVYPFKLSSSDGQPEKFKTLSLAVLAMSSMRQAANAEDDEQKQVLTSVTRAIKKLANRIPKIEQDIEQAANYDQYRKFGELLQIRLPSIKKGQTSVTVDDIYTDPAVSVEIKLDPALTPHANAERYFKKARKGEEGLHLLERRLEISREELKVLEMIRGELEENFDSACERFRSELASLKPTVSSRTGEPTERLPYREHTLSTGLRIFIGRQGADNDRTTFEFTKPYELWFHTQQCAGSHVAIKFPNKSFVPTQAEIEETAAIAAWHSKAKHDSMVPVIYTERKYVRKPRKAKPGLVTVEREKSVMVVPLKPE